MPGGAMLPGAGQAVVVEETAYRLAAQVNTLPFRQDLGQVAVIDTGVLPAGQDDCGDGDILGD